MEWHYRTFSIATWNSNVHCTYALVFIVIYFFYIAMAGYIVANKEN